MPPRNVATSKPPAFQFVRLNPQQPTAAIGGDLPHSQQPEVDALDEFLNQPIATNASATVKDDHHASRGLSTAPVPHQQRRTSADRKRQLSQQGRKQGGNDFSASTSSLRSTSQTPLSSSTRKSGNSVDKIRDELYAWNEVLRIEEKQRQLQRGAMDGV